MRAKFLVNDPTGLSFFLERILCAAKTDDCVLWPFGLNASGYGQVLVNGKRLEAHRRVCERTHGPPPFEKAEAAHKCGVRSCVNPEHIRWLTKSENQLERKIHGTDYYPGPKRLSDDQVGEIRRRYANGETQRHLAKEFGCHQTHISLIVNFKTRIQ